MLLERLHDADEHFQWLLLIIGLRRCRVAHSLISIITPSEIGRISKSGIAAPAATDCFMVRSAIGRRSFGQKHAMAAAKIPSSVQSSWRMNFDLSSAPVYNTCQCTQSDREN